MTSKGFSSYLLNNFQIQFLSTNFGKEIVHTSVERVKFDKWKIFVLSEVERVELLIPVTK